MSGWGWFILVIIILIPAAYFGYVAYRRFKAKQDGQPPPPWNIFQKDRSGSGIYPAPTGPLGWIKNKYYGLRNSRSKTGAYEGDSGAGARGHHRPLDPDEAWDSRVEERGENDGYGGYYEEQELGLQPPPSSAAHRDEYAGTGYGGGSGPGLSGYGGPADVQRGRSLSREIRAEEQTGYLGPERARENPFGDHAEANSLRGVSPRPHQEGGKGHNREVSDGGSLQAGDSPNERRSMFREENV
ncbi:uncharacterized protein KY384_005614 [Bacidia gigantensis]|uniref:uncharacterized protein n=1 Tax=Bacidia gigantensis TaxID=2732470 RepID=UPI001D049847|nr:uncharacterized protein KY384_005614 [Bacidia gigantensis]KAG8530131.1 hypothetical protein KY384_005614 [Bacidia gigantensis]